MRCTGKVDIGLSDGLKSVLLVREVEYSAAVLTDDDFLIPF